MTIAAASSTNWADAMDFHAAMMCPIGVPALACCALDGTLRTSTSNWCSSSCSSRCFQRCPQHDLVLVDYSNDEMRPMVATALPALDWFSGRPTCPRRQHCPRCPTHNTHTHNHTIAATAAVSAPGGAAGTQRSSAAEGDWRRRPAGRRAESRTARALPSGGTWPSVGGPTEAPVGSSAAASRDERFGEPL